MSELRASDAEREQTVQVLRAAAGEGRLDVSELEQRAAYAVTTRSELEALIADVSPPLLAVAGTPGVAVPQSADPHVTVREGPGGSRWLVSLMSSNTRRGRWRVARRCTVLDVMADHTIDLCEAELAAPEVRLTVLAIMASGTVRVPHGVQVQTSGVAIMGANDVRLGDEQAPPGAPVIHVRMISLMGAINVRRGPRVGRAERRRRRELRRAEQQCELEP